MACPDRFSDARIIAEIERRKTMNDYQTEPIYEYITTHDNDLIHSIFMVDINRIEKIEKLEDGWFFTLRII